jgi:hypothetical protein
VRGSLEAEIVVHANLAIRVPPNDECEMKTNRETHGTVACNRSIMLDTRNEQVVRIVAMRQVGRYAQAKIHF